MMEAGSEVLMHDCDSVRSRHWFPLCFVSLALTLLIRFPTFHPLPFSHSYLNKQNVLLFDFELYSTLGVPNSEAQLALMAFFFLAAHCSHHSSTLFLLWMMWFPPPLLTYSPKTLFSYCGDFSECKFYSRIKLHLKSLPLKRHNSSVLYIQCEDTDSVKSCWSYNSCAHSSGTVVWIVISILFVLWIYPTPKSDTVPDWRWAKFIT